MNKIIISLAFLVFLPSMALGNNPAPYSDDALQKIFQAIQDTPKEENAETLSKEEFHKRFASYYATIFEKAGYSFNDTINKIVDDMKNNPGAIPQDRESVYNKVYILLHIMMYECNSDKIDCLQFYPEDTQQSIQWLIDNSEFSKQDTPMHRGGK